ncbi:MAG: GTPase HflX [Myxococcota bacterium]
MLQELFGNTTGLKPHQARALRALYERRVDRTTFVSPPVARSLTELSKDTGRRLGLLINRLGKVEYVVVGDAHRVVLPDLGPKRAGADRFRGVRLVLTGLRPEGLTEDDLTDLALLQLDGVATIRVLPDGLPGEVHYAYLLPPGADGDKVSRTETVRSIHEWEDDWNAFLVDLEAQFARHPQLEKVEGQDRVILVGVATNDLAKARRGLRELERLAETAGLSVVDRVLQRRQKLDGRTVIGAGKLEELIVRSMHLGAEGLIFDRELSPSQLRNIAQTTDMKVLDRTQLILDIFAQHAKSREGKLQVELAQLRYRAPRLAIMPTAMSRLTGGIGGRGPGETKLEMNRRRASERETRLERELDDLARNRTTRRGKRERSGIPVVSIVGYTNAGKSTLLNRMTRSEVLAEDKLFATLDPTTRRMRFPEQREIVLADTVGFIEDLPKTLIAAFKSTLEELEEADLLLQVLDASDPDVVHQRAAVDAVLEELGLQDTPQILVWNKADQADPTVLAALVDGAGGVPGLAISALTGEGLEALLDRVERTLFRARAAEKTRLEQPDEAPDGIAADPPRTVHDVIDHLPSLGGREVDVAGILTLGADGDHLSHFPRAEHRNGIESSSLWATFDAQALGRDREALSPWNTRRVIVHGVITPDRGAWGLFPGGIRVTRITKLAST